MESLATEFVGPTLRAGPALSGCAPRTRPVRVRRSVCLLSVIAAFGAALQAGDRPPDFRVGAVRTGASPIAWPPQEPERPPTADEKGYFAHYRLDPTGAEHRFGTVNGPCGRLAVHVFIPPNAADTVLLVHGYYDHAGIWSRLLPALLENRHAVVAYDQPGHGLSDGPPAAISDFADYLQALRVIRSVIANSALPRPVHTVAHSLGAGILADGLLQGDSVDEGAAVVLLAPLCRSVAWRSSRAGHRLFGRFITQLPRAHPRNSGDPEFLRELRNDPLQADTVPTVWVDALGRWEQAMQHRPTSDRPLLILQGTRDGVVDRKYNIPFFRGKFPNATVVSIPGARHQLANEAKPLRDRVFRQITDALAPPTPQP